MITKETYEAWVQERDAALEAYFDCRANKKRLERLLGETVGADLRATLRQQYGTADREVIHSYNRWQEISLRYGDPLDRSSGR